MFEFFASIFGYLLNFLYELINNYGISIILFTIIIKLLLIPFSIKQQKTLQKSNKIQEKMKVIQFKYKNDPEKMNQEMMNLYKDEKMSPFSGCLTSILQLILILSIFFMVKQPLTYMKKIPVESLNNYVEQLQEEGKTLSNVYPEVDIIRESNWVIEKNPDDENAKKTSIDMNFLGLDLSLVPQQNLNDYRVYVIPILYIISSFISMRITTSMQNKKKDEKPTESTDLTVKEEKNEVDTIMQTNKMMSWMIPIMSISIALVAPLGLALYWLINNVLMIVERLALNKFLKPEEE